MYVSPFRIPRPLPPFPSSPCLTDTDKENTVVSYSTSTGTLKRLQFSLSHRPDPTNPITRSRSVGRCFIVVLLFNTNTRPEKKKNQKDHISFF